MNVLMSDNTDRERFGQLSLWILIAWGVHYLLAAQVFPREPYTALSIFSYLPLWLWPVGEGLIYLKLITLAGLLAWALNLVLVLSVPVALIGLTLVLSAAIAGQLYTVHDVHVVNTLLIFYGGWCLFRREERSRTARMYLVGRAAPYPLWLYRLSLFYLTVGYTYSGWTKLLQSGLPWANGVSLQLWCAGSSLRDSLPGALCLYDVRLSLIGQVIILFVESTCILAFLFSRARIFYGVTLLSFHLGVEVVLGLPFRGNCAAIFLLLILFPLLDREGCEARRTVRSSS